MNKRTCKRIVTNIRKTCPGTLVISKLFYVRIKCKCKIFESEFIQILLNKINIYLGSFQKVNNIEHKCKRIKSEDDFNEISFSSIFVYLFIYVLHFILALALL